MSVCVWAKTKRKAAVSKRKSLFFLLSIFGACTRNARTPHTAIPLHDLIWFAIRNENENRLKENKSQKTKRKKNWAIAICATIDGIHAQLLRPSDCAFECSIGCAGMCCSVSMWNCHRICNEGDVRRLMHIFYFISFSIQNRPSWPPSVTSIQSN